MVTPGVQMQPGVLRLALRGGGGSMSFVHTDVHRRSGARPLLP